MKAYLTTLCGCHKEIEVEYKDLHRIFVVPIVYRTPWTETSPEPSTTYETRTFELVGISNQPAAYYEEVKR